MIGKHIQTVLFFSFMYVTKSEEKGIDGADQLTKDNNLHKDVSKVCFYGTTARRLYNTVYNNGGYPNGECQVEKPRDCADLDKRRCKSGIYTIYVDGSNSFDVYCHLGYQGKGWTVIQRRFNGKTNFYRNWEEYSRGFGNLDEEHWLGNDKLHIMTSHGKYELRIELEDFKQEKRYALYRHFSVGNAESKYTLEVRGYNGNAGDSFTYHNALKFSTYDEDNDTTVGHCASGYKGAWWYGACHSSCLNGEYLEGVKKTEFDGIVWRTWRGYYYSLKATTMMIRKKD